MKLRQLSLLPPPSLEHGGAIRKGRRKIARPFDPKRALHVVMRSDRARGDWSFLHPKNKGRVHALAEILATRAGVRVYRWANAGNHLHFLVKAPSREALTTYLRMLGGLLARLVTGARKGRPVGKFWAALTYSRVVGFGREFTRVKDYLAKNTLEALGFDRQKFGAIPMRP